MTPENNRTLGLLDGERSEEQLAHAFQEGERGAFDAIYARYAQRVSSICRRMLLNPHDAQEAEQDVFLRVYQALPRFNGRYQLGSWIARIATNVCLDKLRARKHHEAELCPMDEHDAEVKELTSPDEPEAWVLRKADSRRVRNVLRDLPPMHRAAIVLRDFEGLTYSEVAAALSITDVQVKALIHRARRRFKRDWRAGVASIFIPKALLQKVKAAGGSANEAGSQAARSGAPFAEVAGSATQTVSHCTVLVQQCGHFMAERFATAATAVAIGAASVAAPTPAPEPSPPAIQEEFDGAVEEESAEPASRRQSGTEGRTVAQTPPTTATASPSPSPTASPSPSPSPTPTDGGGGSKGGSSTAAKPAPSPSPPPPFTSYLGLQGAQGAPEEPWGNEFRLNCSAPSFEQSLRGRFDNSGEKLPADLVVDVRGSNGGFQLGIEKDGEWYWYRSWGHAPSVEWQGVPGDRRLAMSGDYGPVYGADPESVGLPGSGSFQFELSYSCGSAGLKTESLRLSP